MTQDVTKEDPKTAKSLSWVQTSTFSFDHNVHVNVNTHLSGQFVLLYWFFFSLMHVCFSVTSPLLRDEGGGAWAHPNDQEATCTQVGVAVCGLFMMFPFCMPCTFLVCVITSLLVLKRHPHESVSSRFILISFLDAHWARGLCNMTKISSSDIISSWYDTSPYQPFFHRMTSLSNLHN